MCRIIDGAAVMYQVAVGCMLSAIVMYQVAIGCMLSAVELSVVDDVHGRQQLVHSDRSSPCCDNA